MNSTLLTGTGGESYGPDAIPIQDMPSESDAPSFEGRNGSVVLRGSISRSSGSMAFPARQVCLETGARDMEPMTFGPRGMLYSFAQVHISAGRPTPYTLGYVDFENGVRVLCQVESGPGQELHCDQPVELRAEGTRWFVVPIGPGSEASK